jgi:hypothetical protein
MADPITTAFCRCCTHYRPFEFRFNGGASWNLCCLDCSCIIAAFEGHPCWAVPVPDFVSQTVTPAPDEAG